MTTDILSIDTTPATGDQPQTQLVVIGPVGSPSVAPPPEDDNWEIKIDVLRWKMKQKRAFMALVAGTGENGTVRDDNELYPFFALMVKKWPYEYDPSVEANYDELTVEQFNEVLAKVVAAFPSTVQKP